MSRQRTQIPALQAPEEGQMVAVSWAWIDWMARIGMALHDPEIRAWGATCRLRAWGIPRVPGWASVAVWRGLWPSLDQACGEALRGLLLGAIRLRWQVEDGAGRVVWSARWSQRETGRRRAMANRDVGVSGDLVDGREGSMELLARAAAAKAGAAQGEAMAHMTTAFADALVRVGDAHHARYMDLMDRTEHYQTQSVEKWGEAYMWQLYAGSQQNQPSDAQGRAAWIREAKDLLKELGDVGFSLGGLLKGDPEKLMEAWRLKKLAGGENKGGVVAAAVGMLLKRMTPEEWAQLGALVGPENAAELGKSLAAGLGPEKLAKMVGAGLSAQSADHTAILWRSLPAETRATMTRAALGSMSPGEVASLTGSLLSSMTQPGLAAVWRALPAETRARIPLWIASLLSEEERAALIQAFTGLAP